MEFSCGHINEPKNLRGNCGKSVKELIKKFEESNNNIAVPKAAEEQCVAKNRSVIYIGLNDKDTLAQEESMHKCISLVCDICKAQRIEFTLHKSIGGYISDSGEYIIEKGLQLSLLGADMGKTLFVANELKERLNQETVLITEDKSVETHIIR